MDKIKIEKDVKDRILQGGTTAFQKVDKDTISKLPPTLFASVGVG